MNWLSGLRQDEFTAVEIRFALNSKSVNLKYWHSREIKVPPCERLGIFTVGAPSLVTAIPSYRPPSVAGPCTSTAFPKRWHGAFQRKNASFGNEIREVTQISRCLILKRLILDQMETSLLPRGNRFLCGVCRCCNSPQQFDWRLYFTNSKWSRFNHCFLHFFRRNGQKRGKNRDQGVPQLY